MSTSPYDRMMAKVEKTLDCWLFNGALDRNGHGVVRVKVDGKWTTRKAHQVAYTHHKGTLPDGLVVRHTCDVRNCVNPDHLEPGTQRENVGDIIARHRGRNQYGPWVGKAAVAAETEECPF